MPPFPSCGDLVCSRLQLLKAVSSREHPWHQFGTGNAKTLGEDPKKAGVDIRAELLRFHERYYSANLMRLVVLGRATLDELQDVVVKNFHPASDLESSGLTRLVTDRFVGVWRVYTWGVQKKGLVFVPRGAGKLPRPVEIRQKWVGVELLFHFLLFYFWKDGIGSNVWLRCSVPFSGRLCFLATRTPVPGREHQRLYSIVQREGALWARPGDALLMHRGSVTVSLADSCRITVSPPFE